MVPVDWFYRLHQIGAGASESSFLALPALAHLELLTSPSHDPSWKIAIMGLTDRLPRLESGYFAKGGLRPSERQPSLELSASNTFPPPSLMDYSRKRLVNRARYIHET